MSSPPLSSLVVVGPVTSRPVLFAAAMVIGTAACPAPPPPPPEVIEPCGCASDRDCPGSTICDKVNDDDDLLPRDDACGVCVELTGCECNGVSVPCDLRRECEPPPICDPRDPAACPGDTVCLVENGLVGCHAPRLADRCETVLDRRVARAGDVVTASAMAFDVEDGLVPAGPRAVLAECADGVCAQVVAVDVGGVPCAPVTLTVHAAAGPGVRVVVGDEGGPLAGARVRWLRGGVVRFEAVSDAHGAAIFVGVEDAIDEVRVEGDGVEFHSVVDPPPDLLVVTRHLPGQVVAAAGSVDATALHSRGDLVVAFAGLPLSRDVGLFSTVALTGEAIDTPIVIDGVVEPGQRAVGAGVVVGLGATTFKSRWLATTPAHHGRLLVWSLGIRVPLSRAAPLLQEPDGTFDLRFTRFPADHGLVVATAGPPVDVPAMIDVDGNGVADTLIEDGAVGVTVRPDTLLPLSVVLAVDEAPFAASSPTSIMGIGLVGAVVPGVGVLPLGLKAFTAADVEQDPLIVDYSPQRGLEVDVIDTWAFTWPTPPVKDTDTVAFRRGDRWAPLPVASVDATGLSVAAVAGVDVTHVRVRFRDGGIWNLWTPRALAAGEVAVEPGDIEAAAVSAIDLEDGAAFAIEDGGAADIAAFTRVACVDGTCRP